MLGLIAGQVTEANISRLFHWDKTYKTGRVTKNGAEVVKIKRRSSDLRPNHFSFDISFQLPPRQNQSSCLPDESCLEREVEVELHLPTNNFHNSLLEMNVNIGNELATKTKVKLTWEGRGQRGQFPLKYNITNEILFVGRRGHSEKERMCVDGEGELGLGLDGKGEIFDSRDGLYWVVWTGSCGGSSEDGCTYFGIPEMRNLTLFINTSRFRYQESMLHMFERFGNETDPTGIELDKDKIIVFGFWKNLFWSRSKIKFNLKDRLSLHSLTILLFHNGRKFIVVKFVFILYIDLFQRFYVWSLYQLSWTFTHLDAHPCSIEWGLKTPRMWSKLVPLGFVFLLVDHLRKDLIWDWFWCVRKYDTCWDLTSGNWLKRSWKKMKKWRRLDTNEQ